MKKGETVLVRDSGAGVLVGVLERYNLKDGTWRLKAARKIWSWLGALSVEDIACRGCGGASKLSAAAPMVEGRNLDCILQVAPRAKKVLAAIPEFVK